MVLIEDFNRRIADINPLQVAFLETSLLPPCQGMTLAETNWRQLPIKIGSVLSKP